MLQLFSRISKVKLWVEGKQGQTTASKPPISTATRPQIVRALTSVGVKPREFSETGQGKVLILVLVLNDKVLVLNNRVLVLVLNNMVLVLNNRVLVLALLKCIPTDVIQMLDLENIVLAIAISFLSHLKAEI